MTASTPDQIVLPNQKIIIIGGSHAGIACAERLRKLGHKGSITIIERLSGLPLERPPLSKAFLKAETTEDKSFSLRPDNWFADNNITFMDGYNVTSIAPDDHQLNLSDGQVLEWDQLVLATGAYPRPLPVAGGDSDQLIVLRHPEDARRLREKLYHAQKVIIIGGGYIGLEVAASARALGKDVSVIEAADRLLARVASRMASSYFDTLHQSHGVAIYRNTQVSGIVPSGNQITVTTNNHSSIDADLVIAGIGVIPDMDIATKAGITTGNGIMTDAFYRTNRPDIFAIGDVALPADGYTDGQIRLESVHHAQMSADIAAHTMMNQTTGVHEVPWFWSEQYDQRLQSAGLVPAEHETVRRDGRREGQVSFWSFTAEGRFAAVESLNDGQAYMVGRHLLSSTETAQPITIDLIADPNTDLKSLMKR
jgi:NADPH-dependent 2,4-dienoyl-CoA reductase/sulfur reductase-like enzyme